MSFSSHCIVSLYVVAALLGAVGSGATANAQTTAPPAAEAAGSLDAAETPATKPEVAATVASEQAPPAPAPATEPSGASTTPAAPQAAPTATAEPPVPATTAAETATPSAPAPAASDPPPLTIDVPAALARAPGIRKIEKRDRDGLVAAYKARGDRPIWMTVKGATPEALKLAAEIAKAGDWGLDASQFDVPRLTAASPEAPDLSAEALADAEVRLSLATLKYARHARGGRFEPTDLTPFLDRKSPLLEPASVLEQIATAADPDDYLRRLHPQHTQFELLRQRYLAVRGEPAPRKGPSEAERTLANMEQWRWMPADLGRFHVWVNLPEQLLRVVRDGRVIHTERIVIGKPNAQTPVFSHEMKHLIFYPFWGVPDSIKTNELLPGLQRGRAILARQNLKLQLNGRDVDPSRYDWSRTDIRRFHVYQPPGRGNALGIVKFMFPNKHAVYMHDTPSKSLFKASVRAFSHGCMRVQDPIRFAELILAEDRGMSPEQVRALARPGAPENNQVNLSRHIPVHMVYFTERVDEAGKVASFKDIYGHEKRVRLALAGKMDLIEPVEQPKTPTDPIGRLVESSPSRGEYFGQRGYGGGGYSGAPANFNTARPDWAKRVFSGSGSFAGGG